MEFVYVNSESDRDKLIQYGLKLMGQKQGASFWAFHIGDLSYEESDKILETLDQFVLSNVLMF